MCQNQSFVGSFICYKQKCEMVSFNLGHPVVGLLCGPIAKLLGMGPISGSEFYKLNPDSGTVR